MARGQRKQAGQAEPGAAAPAVHVIHPNAVYHESDLIRHLRFGRDGFRRLVRQGRLRASMPRGELVTLGEWLLEWIRENEVKKGASGGAAA